MTRPRWLAAVVLLLAVAACAGGSPSVEVGRSAPALEAPAIVEGERVDLASFAGRPTLVNFWGSWCDPCRRELPRLVEAQRGGTAILGVAVRDSRRRAREMLTALDATWASADDPEGTIARRWGVSGGFPVTFAIDAGGVVRGRRFGEMSTEDVAALVAAARG